MPYGVPSQGIRPGMVERGVEYARKAAHADGYWTARNGLPLPLMSDVRPFAREWREGYAVGQAAREEYDHAEAVASRPESRRRIAALDRPSASRGSRSAGGGADDAPPRGALELRATVAIRAGGASVTVGLAVGR